MAHTNNSLLQPKNKSFYKKPSKSIPTLNIGSSITHNLLSTSHKQHQKIPCTTTTNQTNPKPQPKHKTQSKNQSTEKFGTQKTSTTTTNKKKHRKQKKVKINKATIYANANFSIRQKLSNLSPFLKTSQVFYKHILLGARV
jgi:hypothetical protein